MKENIACLERRLSAWNAGVADSLVREGRAIQSHFAASGKPRGSMLERRSYTFSSLVYQGKLRFALRFLDAEPSGGVLPLDSIGDQRRTVLDVLHEKHLPSQQVSTVQYFTFDRE